MKRINNYIIEKLIINKDIAGDFDEPIFIKFWLYYKTSLDFLEERLKKITQIEYLNISYLGKTTSEGDKLIGFKIINQEDLINIYSYIISQYPQFGLLKDDFNKLRDMVNQYMIDNYNDIRKYLDSISDDEIKEYLKKYVI